MEKDHLFNRTSFHEQDKRAAWNQCFAKGHWRYLRPDDEWEHNGEPNAELPGILAVCPKTHHNAHDVARCSNVCVLQRDT